MTGTAPVTAVVPLFNGRRYIREALDSILSQDPAPREVLVVDDGSTDGGADLVAGNGQVRILRQANAGEAAARNRGVREARESLIAFLDQDDIWLPGKLALQVPVFSGDASIGVAYGRHRLLVAEDAPWFRRDLLGQALTARLPGTLLIRRTVFETVGLFREDLKLGSDVDWIWRAGDAGVKFQMVEADILLRRLHGANASMDMPQFASGLLDAARSALKRKRAADSAEPGGG